MKNYLLPIFFLFTTLSSKAAEIIVTPTTGKQLLKTVQSIKADIVVLNLWATWCAPCTREFPEIIKLYQKYQQQNVELILVSADFEPDLQNVKTFLEKQGVTFPTYLKKQKDLDFIAEIDQKWKGVLPSTFIYDRQKKVRYLFEEEITYEKLEHAILSLLKEKP